MSIRTIPTTTRSRKWEKAHPVSLAQYTDTEIAKAAGRERESVSLLVRAAERRFRRVWNLWATVDFDERRRGEIRRELEAIEKGKA